MPASRHHAIIQRCAACLHHVIMPSFKGVLLACIPSSCHHSEVCCLSASRHHAIIQRCAACLHHVIMPSFRGVLFSCITSSCHHSKVRAACLHRVIMPSFKGVLLACITSSCHHSKVCYLPTSRHQWQTLMTVQSKWVSHHQVPVVPYSAVSCLHRYGTVMVQIRYSYGTVIVQNSAAATVSQTTTVPVVHAHTPLTLSPLVVHHKTFAMHPLPHHSV